MKSYAEACDQNREPILAVLRQCFADRFRVLEIGSGTGQHAAWLPKFLPHLQWQASDVAPNLPGIRQWLEEAALPNARPPIELDVDRQPWPQINADAVFSANTAHIISWASVCRMFAGIAGLLPPGGRFALNGPFYYGGRATAASNARFDESLRKRDQASGVRDFDDLQALAERYDMRLLDDIEMPVNNRILVWARG